MLFLKIIYLFIIKICFYIYMEAIQVEINKIRNENKSLKVKNHLLKIEYQKVKELNKKLRSVIEDINKRVSVYIEHDE